MFLNTHPQKGSWIPLPLNRLVGLVVKASASRAEDSGFESRLCRDFFSGSSHTSDFKIGTPVLPFQAPGIIESALGLVGPVSVYCDWVRWKVGSATSISVWQHIKLSEQIRPWATLACCWNVKQPTNNKQTNLSPSLPSSSLLLPRYLSKGLCCKQQLAGGWSEPPGDHLLPSSSSSSSSSSTDLMTRDSTSSQWDCKLKAAISWGLARASNKSLLPSWSSYLFLIIAIIIIFIKQIWWQ